MSFSVFKFIDNKLSFIYEFIFYPDLFANTCPSVNEVHANIYMNMTVT